MKTGAQNGLSPRVRGSLQREVDDQGRQGSIPAGAGEPARRRRDRSGQRSIPAGAGEPRLRDFADKHGGVYPRGCGGAQGEQIRLAAELGLSPRVRGSLCIAPGFSPYVGSIPAGAGEPTMARPFSPGRGVYPRGCGGAAGRGGGARASQGLSPRVRGSQAGRVDVDARFGSIPAGAGEPGGLIHLRRVRGVYPRGCGGAKRGSATPMKWGGLSPRVRGSLHCAGQDQLGTGSIPAGAGEPSPGVFFSLGTRVYPRGCGGAYGVTNSTRSVLGLSPRVRGSRRHGRPFQAIAGSIPAGAGEPSWPLYRAQSKGVYPRGCRGAPR